MSDLKLNIRKRGGIKHSLTAFNTYLESTIGNDQFDNKIIIELTERVGRLEGLFLEFCEIQSKIEQDCDEKNLSEQYGVRTEFETSYFESISKAKAIINEKTPEESLALASEHSGSQDRSVTGYNNKAIKLPPIQLPKFSGSYEQWLEFRDTFNSIIHNDTTLSEVQKLHYLRSSLQGQAAQIIRSLQTCETNYQVAWKLLCERYDNKRVLVGNHIKALFNLPKVRGESSSELRKLVDEFSKHLLALDALGQPKEQYWNALLIYLISSKLDNQIKREWEASILTSEFPAVEEMKKFLTGRCQLLKSLESENKRTHHVTNKHVVKRMDGESTTTLLATGVSNANLKCGFCNDETHLIYSCENFLKLNAYDRTTEMKTRKLCVNCLKKNHFSFTCKAGTCRKCGKKHHSLLHYDGELPNTTNKDQVGSQNLNVTNRETEVVRANCSSIKNTQVLLSTAIVRVKGNTGDYRRCKALLDSGSESCFITRKLCEKVKLQKSPLNLVVIGINQISSGIKHKAEIHLQSCHSTYNKVLICFVIDKITENIPTNSFDASRVAIPNHVKLADENFNKNSEIEILLGANVFWELLCPEQIRINNKELFLQNTRLGWVLGGSWDNVNNGRKNAICNVSKTIEIQEQLKGFWELEECGRDVSISNGGDVCEHLFQKTTEKSPAGRYIVSIPFIEAKPNLGESYGTALKRFYKVEASLDRNFEMKQQYIAFMREYEALGHMAEVAEPIADVREVYYLPHHGVIKETSSTTKLRVVFDGSCKTTNNMSLNDCQYAGPTIQDDLFSILVRFRTYRYVLSADIEKMYRQVLIQPDQRDYQRIVWREKSSDRLKHYTLNTVTYGTASAPFLAIRSLQQTAHDHRDQYERAAQIILHDFYVDDLLSGADTRAEAIQLHNEIKFILNSGGFSIRKWRSNSQQILNEITSRPENKDTVMLEAKADQKTLGLCWVSSADYLQIKIDEVKVNATTTKRDLLAAISKIFDPLGLLGSCIIIAKIMLQQLWKCKLGWDDAIPDTLNAQWNRFAESLIILNQIQILRYVPCRNAKRVELHVFSDASKVAYGACIYVRTIEEDNSVSVYLLCAKSRVAPLKETTIPRLELCGALIAARLASKVIKSLNTAFDEISFWCDSTIVLSWIRMPVGNLKIFVSHRVAEIQKLTDTYHWNHVGTADNPADLISRGVWPKDLIKSIWWKGPHWLELPNSHWPSTSVSNIDELPEVKDINITVAAVHTESSSFPFRYTSLLHKLKRIVAWCLRFRENCRLGAKERNLGVLTTTEVEEAMIRLVKLAQAEDFLEEFKILNGNGELTHKSKLIQLSPFLDAKGLLRVGGRLENSNFNFGKKHPLLLSGKHKLTRLIFEAEHLRLLHAGPQLLLASVRERFWPIGGRNLAKFTVHRCITCYRAKPVISSQIMGNLPTHRVTAMYPFFAVGVDYAGPFFIKDRKGRGCRTTKCYISLFVCFATKAIHLEPVTDLTTESFLSTLRRFISRRGKPTHIYSDNGSNYIGAKSKLKELGSFLIQNGIALTDSISRENISWHFIPANSPHFGGLWEAGIKSTKHHLKRVLTNALVTLEEFLTILTQVEGVLNSRPLHPISNSPNDYEPLTPSHFLIGRPATNLPDPKLTDQPINRLQRFQYLQQIVQHFWGRWSQEYITQLQQKVKWTTKRNNVKVGDLVVIREDNLPALKWKMGRIIDIHPGDDGMVRVVSVKTPSGILKRAVAKVCVLPICEDDDKNDNNPSAN